MKAATTLLAMALIFVGLAIMFGGRNVACCVQQTTLAWLCPPIR